MSRETPPRITIPGLDLTEAITPYLEFVAEKAAEKALRYYQPQPEEIKLLKLEEAADRLQVTKQTLAALRESGEIKTTYIGSLVRIRSTEIDKYLKD